MISTCFKLKPYCSCIFLYMLLFPNVVVTAQPEKSWRAPKQIAAKLEKEKSGFNYYEEKVPAYILPDIFTTNDGIKVKTSDFWTRVRRPEILELFRKNIYGRIPETPYQKKFKVVSLDQHAMGG